MSLRNESIEATSLSDSAQRTHWGRAYLEIARPDHWFKNVFVIPGIVVAIGTIPSVDWRELLRHTVVGALAICTIASSYYTLNEILDAPFDRLHPTKHSRPVPSGRVNVRIGYTQWLLLFVLGMALAWTVSLNFAATLGALWLMACAYNVPPIRTKDKPILDVVSEAVNNPLRMMAGWFIVTSVTLPPASLLLSYWMIGCYFMALKRFAEFRNIDDPARAAAYRKSFAWYTADRLIVSVMFYSAAAMLFFGAFCMRYRMELILAFPGVALVMAMYLRVALRPQSAAQEPEHLYRERGLMLAVVGTAIAMSILLVVDIPSMHRFFTPTAPVQSQRATN